MHDVASEQTKKRSLFVINEHFESVFNKVFANVVVMQRSHLLILGKNIMSLDTAPDHIKLAVDLIELLEEHNLDEKITIDALKIALNDFENKLAQKEKTRNMS